MKKFIKRFVKIFKKQKRKNNLIKLTLENIPIEIFDEIIYFLDVNESKELECVSKNIQYKFTNVLDKIYKDDLNLIIDKLKNGIGFPKHFSKHYICRGKYIHIFEFFDKNIDKKTIVINMRSKRLMHNTECMLRKHNIMYKKEKCVISLEPIDTNLNYL